MFDNSLKTNKISSSHKDYDLKKELLKNKKIDKKFLLQLNHLKLEELISLKLDSSALSLGGKLLNFPILKFAADIAKEAVVKFALSNTKTKKDAALILGVTKSELNRLIKLYEIEF